MYQGEIYLSIQDMMRLMGSYNRNYAQRKHKAMREQIRKGKAGLSIGDFCRLTGDDYNEIYAFLRGKLPLWGDSSSLGKS